MSIGTKLRVTRDKLAEFIKDHDTIKQFEKLIKYINNMDVLTVGDTENGNYLYVCEDGTWQNFGEGVVWDETTNSFVGSNIFTVAGRVDYNFTELTLDFNTNARYPEEPVAIVTQLGHAREADSDIRPHVHWMQNSDNNPNILIQYRMYNNGAVPPAWILKALTASDNFFPYVAGGQQVTQFNLPDGHGVGLGLSFTVDMKIYRDSANTSGLFAGADTYAGVWSAKYYDIHYQIDMNGSRDEYVK